METRTLSQVINNPNQMNQAQGTRSLSTYLTVFSINLAHRFPDVDLDLISYDVVQQIAEFSFVCSTIALETWDQRSQRDTQQKRRVA